MRRAVMMPVMMMHVHHRHYGAVSLVLRVNINAGQALDSRAGHFIRESKALKQNLCDCTCKRQKDKQSQRKLNSPSVTDALLVHYKRYSVVCNALL